ncbi:MAG TPA: hypothetical protein VFW11_23370 [Cyclobacteriaceae bacterium]|nr:hypothetical protein [Cyclobacteriaceae bacterium]
MNNLKVLTLAGFILMGMIACSRKNETPKNEQSLGSDEWADMDSFHMIMAESFHPFSDSGNLQPAKEHAAAMEELAAHWASASLPDKVNNDDMKSRLNELKISTANFNTLVADSDDKVLGDSLTKIHDLFHHIMESWHGGGEHHTH